MTIVREILALLAAFTGGSSTLICLSFLQKSIAELPQQHFSVVAKAPTSYIIPFFAGGTIGIAIYLLCRRIKHLNCQSKAQPQHSTEKMSTGLLLAYVLIGGAILCLFSTIQKSINGYPMQLKGYMLPALVGSISGFIVGLLQLRIYRLLHYEQQATTCLQQERDQTLDIIASISDGLIVTDNSGNIALVNDTAAKMLELTREQIQGKTLVQALTAATGRQDLTAEKINTVDAVNQFTIAGKDGALRAVRSKTSALRSRNTNSKALIMLLHDNTEEQHIDRMKSEFISSATHNLKTPITAITGYTELLQSQQHFTPEQTTEFLNYINDKAWELNTLINNMLDINRAEAGSNINLTKKSINIATLFDHIKNHCASQSTPCTFSFDIQDNDCYLYIDQHKVDKVLENIINNSIKFSPDGGTITISGARASGEDAGTYQISVADEGIGMSANQCLRMFDKFYRADSSDSGQQGIGLGLTLAKNFVEAHEGKIFATSTLGAGTTLSFYLPISDTAGHAN